MDVRYPSLVRSARGGRANDSPFHAPNGIAIARKVVLAIIQKEEESGADKMTPEALHIVANVCHAWPACKADVRRMLAPAESDSKVEKWVNMIFN
jgi:hypothetical protein